MRVLFEAPRHIVPRQVGDGEFLEHVVDARYRNAIPNSHVAEATVEALVGCPMDTVLSPRRGTEAHRGGCRRR